MTDRTNYWQSLANRNLSRRRLLKGSAIAGVGLAGVGLVGCGGDDDDAEPTSGASTPGGSTPGASATAAVSQPRPGGTYRERSIAAPSAWDPYLNSSYSAQQHWGHMTNKLLRYAYGPEYMPNDTTLAPDIASALPEQPDPLTMVIPIREGVKFHNVAPVNGRAMTAEDVKWSFDRYLSMGQQKSAYGAIQSVEATDAKTITLKLKKPAASLYQTLGDPKLMWVLAREAVGEAEIGPTSPFVGVGPFMFEKYETEVQMSFVRNPDYWEGEGKPYFDRLEMAIIPQEPTLDAQFRSDQMTWVTVQDKERLEALTKGVKDAGVLNYLAQGMQVKEFALDRPPFNNPMVRRALNLAVDRDEIPQALGSIDYAWHTHAFPASYTPFFLDPKSPEFGENGKNFAYNPAEAKKLLEAAGFTDKKPLKFNHIYTSEYAGEQLTAELLVDQFSRVGVEMTLEQYAYTDYQQKFKVKDSSSFRNWDGLIGNRPASFADPAGYFTTYWNPNSTRSMQKWEDPKLQSMFDASEAELDREARVEQFHEMQRHMHSDDVLNVITIHTEGNATIWQPYVQNMYPRLNYARGAEMIAQLWFDKA